jgi:hypothetical protein
MNNKFYRKGLVLGITLLFFGASIISTTTSNNISRDGWVVTKVISTVCNDTSGRPSMAVDSNGNIHIAWHDYTIGYGGSGNDRDIFYRKYEVGAGWTSIQVVSTESDRHSYWPSVAVDTSGDVHIAWLDTSNYNGAGYDRDIFYKRYEVGSGWTTTEVVSTESSDESYMPTLDADSSGNVHVAWYEPTDYGGSGPDTDVYYKRYEVGSGWTSTELVSTESTSGSYYPSLGVDSTGDAHISWYDFTDYGGAGSHEDVFYKRYEIGSGWTTTEVVSTESTSAARFPSLAIDTNDDIHIAWEDFTAYGGSGSDCDIFYKQYEAGVGWTTSEVVSTESSNGSAYPSLDIDSSGNKYVAWHDSTSYYGCGSDYDVFYKKYDVDSGWGTTEVVSTESTLSSLYPCIAVEYFGQVHVTWEDDTDYEGSGSDRDVFYKQKPVEDTLILTDFKLIQVVKDANAYITNKSTAAYVEIYNSYNVQKLEDIEITYNYGEIFLETGPYGNGVPIKPGLNKVYIPGGPVIHETGQTDPWIPPHGPAFSWDSPGIDNNIKATTTYSADELTLTETFYDSIFYKLFVTPVYFPDADPVVWGEPFIPLNISGQLNYLYRLFPISKDKWHPIMLPSKFSDNPPRNINDFWAWIYTNVTTPIVTYAQAHAIDRVVIVLHENWDVVLQGYIGKAIGILKNPSVQEPVVVQNVWGNGSLVAHELGHTYWLWHPHDIGPVIYDCERYDVDYLDYEEEARTHMSYWWRLPADVPADNAWIDKGRYDSDQKARPPAAYPQHIWVWNLLDQFADTQSTKKQSQDVLVLGGTIYKDGTVDAVDPWYQISEGEPNIEPSEIGDYFIVLKDSQYNILGKYGFNVSFEDWIDNSNGDITHVYTDSTSFVYTIPFTTGAKFIELRDENNIIVLNKIISTHSPTVEVTYPNGGEELEIGKEYTITWDASDDDGDDLTYSVSYSTDGDNWLPIDWQLSEKSCIWDTTGLNPGDSYKIQVLATDGINTGTDESDNTFALITITLDPPTILGPTEGKVGVEYDYIFRAVDPDGYDIKFVIEWGDGITEETDFYDSGTNVIADHTWNKVGSYVIRAKAVNTNFAESPWATLSIVIPRNRILSNPILQWILELFPNAFPILRNILKLL